MKGRGEVKLIHTKIESSMTCRGGVSNWNDVCVHALEKLIRTDIKRKIWIGGRELQDAETAKLPS